MDPSGISTDPVQPVASTAPPTPPERFPLVRVTSDGPLGRNTKIEIGGIEQQGVTRADLSWDVNDINRLVMERLVRVEVEAPMYPETRSYRVVVPAQPRAVEAKADTLWQALADCAEQLRRSEQAVPAGDTVQTT